MAHAPPALPNGFVHHRRRPQPGERRERHADWDAVATINDDREAHVLTLDVNYRTPEEIMRVATECCAPRTLRSTHRGRCAAPVTPWAVAAPTSKTRWRRHGRHAADEVAATEAGTVACSCPTRSRRQSDPKRSTSDSWSMGVDQVRGLEFDSVIVVEPSRFGANELYVALTRATARLTVVHADPLPDAVAVHLA